jgi:hypothetical protein
VKRTAFVLLLTMLLSAFSWAADNYKQGKIVKWENSTYADKSKKHPTKNWVVYQLHADTSTYSIARKKETKPEMQAGDVVQYQINKKNEMQVVLPNGKKREYQIVGQNAGPGQ